MQKFKLTSSYEPSGDQPEAIKKLLEGIDKGYDFQTLLGVTGSGKTFTAANIIQALQKPTLVIAHNKTLAAQLAQEYQDFFPDAAVHYFVSYYDYYQPEAYMPVTDTYIEKDAQINEEIDRLRHASTQALLTRSDVIIVASVSCIYGLGSPQEYRDMHMIMRVGERASKRELLEKLISIHYERTNADLKPGTFRSIGNKIEIMPISEKTIFAVSLMGSSITQILHINPITSHIVDEPAEVFLFPAKHFITDIHKKEKALKAIEEELEQQLALFDTEGKLLEAERLKRRTRYDLAMIREMGYCNGIENYSRHLSQKLSGEPPETLLSYFPKTAEGKPDFLTIIDESHVTVPQIGGMYNGDQARKSTLVEHGFRLPSAKDNRPLRFEEFIQRIGQTIFTTATPSKYEHAQSKQIVEQIIRPTGLVDPEITVLPVTAESSNTKPLSPSDSSPLKKVSTKTLIVESPSMGGGRGLAPLKLREGEGGLEDQLISISQIPGYPGQIQHFISDAIEEIKKGGRVLATTLTKKMAEDLTSYLKDRDMRVEYVHSDVDTLDRIKILTSLRKGEFDCLVGVNLLREGLDLPEVRLVAVLDADKEGFLRSDTALIQTIGRAARNVDGRVTLYADRITGSMQRAIQETNRRRAKQLAYNAEHGITPQSIQKSIKDITEQLQSEHERAVGKEIQLDMDAFGGDIKKVLQYKKEQMHEAVKTLDFETAALIRDEMKFLEEKLGEGGVGIKKKKKK